MALDLGFTLIVQDDIFTRFSATALSLRKPIFTNSRIENIDTSLSVCVGSPFHLLGSPSILFKITGTRLPLCTPPFAGLGFQGGAGHGKTTISKTASKTQSDAHSSICKFLKLWRQVPGERHKHQRVTVEEVVMGIFFFSKFPYCCYIVIEVNNKEH